MNITAKDLESIHRFDRMGEAPHEDSEGREWCAFECSPMASVLRAHSEFEGSVQRRIKGGWAFTVFLPRCLDWFPGGYSFRWISDDDGSCVKLAWGKKGDLPVYIDVKDDEAKKLELNSYSFYKSIFNEKT